MDARLTLDKRILGEIASYDGTMAVYANDLKGNIIALNADEPFETASTVKTYILACLYQEVERGNKSLEDMLVYREEFYVNGSGILKDLDFGVSMTVKNVATLMIIVSDNIATNMMINYLGIDTINQAIAGFDCPNTILHNPIDFDKYDKLGTTTPREYASMFERIAGKSLVSPHACQEMLSIFKKQHYNSMLIKNLPAYCFDSDDGGDEDFITIASKSGSMNACRNDGGIITTPYGQYVLVLMNKNFHDPLYYADHSATVFGSKVSRMIFDQYLALEGRFVL